VPEVTNFKPSTKITDDVAADLSEMPPALLDYSTLLNTLHEDFGHTDSVVQTTDPPKGMGNGSEISVTSDSDSSRFRVLAANSPVSKTYPPGEDYLKFVGRNVNIPGEPSHEQAAEGAETPSDRAKESVHRESGLLFRKSPIKRA
jgi:hypothetical protein